MSGSKSVNMVKKDMLPEEGTESIIFRRDKEVTMDNIEFEMPKLLSNQVKTVL